MTKRKKKNDTENEALYKNKNKLDANYRQKSKKILTNKQKEPQVVVIDNKPETPIKSINLKRKYPTRKSRKKTKPFQSLNDDIEELF